MAQPNSLEQFFSRTDPATLNNCDQENIHLSGTIQNIGALLVTDPETHEVIGASENAADLLGFDMVTLLQSSLYDIDAELAEKANETGPEPDILYETLEFEVVSKGVNYDTVMHTHAGRRIIEFVPNHETSIKAIRNKMRECSKACTRILHAANFDDALKVAVECVRTITGYSRAKIYEFQADWSGKVVAESNDGALPSYLGLCFPESDIPKQVREIMRIVPHRSIGTVSDDVIAIRARPGELDQIDLTWSVNRSVSTMHSQYLRNIGVGSSFSCSLMYQDTLWGLIALHNKTSDPVPYDSWTLVQEISTALMLRYAQQQRNNTAEMISRLRVIENGFATALRKTGNVEEVISQLGPALQDFLGADGFAFQFGSNLHVSGRTPPPEFVTELIKWAMNWQEKSDQYQTVALHRDWDKGKDHIDTCCGVLVQPIVVHRVCQLIWFRGPITRTVHWAGKPEKTTGEPTLGPRNSFDTWIQQHNDQSAPWREDQLAVAREVFTEFLDIIASQILLEEENESLRQFAAVAAHDLKAPLLGLNAALEWMIDDNFDPESVKEMHTMAQQSSKRMADLTEGLLELAMLEKQTIKFEQVSIEELIDDIRHLLVQQISQSGAQITVGALPLVGGTNRLLLRLFLNLVQNAIKYHDRDSAPHIELSDYDAGPGFVGVAVTDNGPGIKAEFAEKVFKPLLRLHGKDEVDGTGLGLTICQRIIHSHNGEITLDTEYAQGARFLLKLPVYKAAAE